MMPLPSIWVAFGLLAAGAAGGYIVAAKIAASKVAQAEHRRIECEHAREQDARAAAEKTAELIARAQDAEAKAAARLSAARAEYDRKLKEIRHDLYRLSTGRECLAPDLRLRLNQAISPDDVPARAGAAGAAAAAASADSVLPAPSGRGAWGGGATDADIAAWIIDAARFYDECRARIDAIRQWDEVTYGR